METRQPDRWALVLGATAGTGAAICKNLLSTTKLNLIGLHRGNHPESVTELTRFAEQHERRCLFLTGDAGEYEQLEGQANTIADVLQSDKIKFFVHSIADGSYGHFVHPNTTRLHVKQMRKTMEKMAHSFVYWAQILNERDLLAPRSTLLGLTSNVPDSLINGLGMISAAKAALEIYVRHLAMELGPQGHSACLVKFGLVDTDAIRMKFAPDDFAQIKTAVARAAPLRRLTTVEEVAKLVALIAQHDLDCFTGSTIDFTAGSVQSLHDLFYRPYE